MLIYRIVTTQPTDRYIQGCQQRTETENHLVNCTNHRSSNFLVLNSSTLFLLSNYVLQ